MNENRVTIELDGRLTNISEDNLRINDLVVIQTGDIVPADLKLVEARALQVDEFDLTGELLPVFKVGGQDTIVYRGSKVISGTGKGLVVAIGEETEYGRILKQGQKHSQSYKFRLIDKKYLWPAMLFLPAMVIRLIQSENPLLATAIFALLFLGAVLLQNDDLYKHLIISNESKKLERANIQIRDRKAVESMGAVTVVCFDKTGVLTTRRMGIKNLHFADQRIDAPGGLLWVNDLTRHLLNTACALCNDVMYYEKFDLANPIDKALISFAQANGIDLNEIYGLAPLK